MNGWVIVPVLVAGLLVAGGALLLLALTGQRTATAMLARLGPERATTLRALVAGCPVILAACAILYWGNWNPTQTDFATVVYFVAMMIAAIGSIGAIPMAFEVFLGLLGAKSENPFVDVVQSQKPYDTGGAATEEQIHRALAGQIPDDTANRITFDE